jgi:hypothetical protein
MSSINDELYLEEKEEAMKKAQMLSDARSRAIPGLLAPSAAWNQSGNSWLK